MVKDENKDYILETFKVKSSDLFEKNTLEKVLAEFSSDLENTRWDKYKSLLSVENSETLDYYEAILYSIAMFKYGKVAKSKSAINKIVAQQLKYKNLHRIEEILNLAKRYSCSSMIDAKTIEVAKLLKGNFEDVTYEKNLVEHIGITDIKKNASIYLRNESIFCNFMSMATIVLEVEEILEAVLKGLPVIPSEVLLEEMYRIARKHQLKDIVEVILKYSDEHDKLIQSNVKMDDDFTSVKRNIKSTSKTQEIEIERIFTKFNEKVSSDFSTTKDLYTNAKQKMYAEDYIGALALFRETLFEETLDKTTYLAIVLDMARCYERIGGMTIAKKLSDFCDDHMKGVVVE